MRNALRRRLAPAAAIALALVLAIPATASGSAGPVTVDSVEYLGQQVIPTGTMYSGTEIGGLSSITYDAHRGQYYAISDDQGNRGTGDPVRYYTMTLDFDETGFTGTGVDFTDVTQLYDVHGQAFAPGGVDPEGLVYDGRSQLYVSAEGILGDPIVDPFIRRYNMNGRPTAPLLIPDKYIPNGVDFGVRQNLSFESLNFTPNGRTLVTAGEGALYQDGPASSFTNGSLARILTYDARKRRPTGEYVYEVEPWAEPSAIFGVNGIAEVLPLDNKGTMLVMERSFSVGGTLGGGTGNVINIYEISTTGATNVLPVDALYDGATPIDFTPVSKRLVFSFDSLGIPIDNIEGMTFGPDLPDGRKSLVLVSDNNFAASQFTQFVVLALDLD
ncbi:MAG: esterase-like activity of phytase family protein [Acidimicrobiia bacterium]